MTKRLIATLLAASVAATPAFAAPRDTPAVKLEKMLAGRVAGTPVRCISLAGSPSSTIIDKTAIVFRSGSTYYVNTPRSGAESLDDDDILVLKPFGSQLCSIDTVHLVDRTSHFQNGFVFLGDFVPYKKPKG